VASAATTFAHNGDGLRDSLTFDSSTTTFTWDVNTPIPQVLDDEALLDIATLPVERGGGLEP
jgi:hypothetical protein